MTTKIQTPNRERTTEADIWNKIIENENVETPQLESTEPTPEVEDTPVIVEEATPSSNETNEAPSEPEELPVESTAPADEVNEPSTGDESLTTIEDWDDKETPESVPTKLDFADIRQKANIETDVDSTESLVEYIKNTRKELDEANQVKNKYNDMPDDLKNAYDVYQQNGDYKAYLGVNDPTIDKLDPITLYEEKISEFFKTPDGGFDEDGFNEYLDKQDTKVMTIEGERIKQERKTKNDLVLETINNKTSLEKERATLARSGAVQDLKDVGGFVVSDKHKASLKEGLTTGKAMKELFHNSDGSYNYKKEAENIFILQNFDKMSNFLKQRAKVQATRETLNELQNPTINTPAINPSDSAPRAAPSGLDLFINTAKETAERRVRPTGK
jgi:hypothetical protein